MEHIKYIMSKTRYEEISKTGTTTGWVIVPIRIQEQGPTEMMSSGKTVGTEKSRGNSQKPETLLCL